MSGDCSSRKDYSQELTLPSVFYWEWQPYQPKPDSVETIRSDEGLTLETSASESLYGGQFTLSTQLIKPNYLVIFPPMLHHTFFRNLPPLNLTYSSTMRPGEKLLRRGKLSKGFLSFFALKTRSWYIELLDWVTTYLFIVSFRPLISYHSFKSSLMRVVLIFCWLKTLLTYKDSLPWCGSDSPNYVFSTRTERVW